MSRPITQIVLDAVESRLADPTTGFNARLSAIVADYGVNPITINFSSASRNFFRVQMDPAVLEQETSVRGTYALLYGYRTSVTNSQKSHMFSGTVIAGLDIHVMMPFSSDMESLPNAIEEAVLVVLNDVSNQDWDSEIAYNGEVSLTKLPVVAGVRDHMRKTLRFTMQFEVNQA